MKEKKPQYVYKNLREETSREDATRPIVIMGLRIRTNFNENPEQNKKSEKYNRPQNNI